MFPELRVHPIYPIGLAIAILACAITIYTMVKRDGHAMRRVVLFMAVLLVGSIATAKGASFLFRGGVMSLSEEVLGGFRYPGSLFGMMLFGFLARRLLPPTLSLARFADLATPGYLLGLSIGRLNCFVVGCCHGKICDLPWAIQFPRGSIAWAEHYGAGLISLGSNASLLVHPFQLYLFAMEILLAAITFAWSGRTRFDSQLFWIALAAHGSLKTLLEFFRSPYSLFHQSVLLFSLLAVIVLFTQRRTRAQREKLVPGAA